MEIIIPKGIKIGHEQDDFTGVTVILSERGCVAGVDVRGGAPGTRETDLLRPEKAVQKINAVVLSGGSAYGLAASTGVMEFLRANNIGHKMGKKVVPIVCGAVIYDLNDVDYHYPNADMGYRACRNADNKPTFGQVGAGKGATCGKLRGLKYASKSGIGAYTVKLGGTVVTAVVCVNALGDVVDKDGKIIAGAKGKEGFIDSNECIMKGKIGSILFGSNTTIGCVMTNADLSKVEANLLAKIAHNGLARAIRPVHTEYDGDTLFCMSTGKTKLLPFPCIETMAVEAVENAIRNAASSGVGYEISYSEE